MTAEVENWSLEQGATFSRGWIFYAPEIDPITGNVLVDANGNPIPSATPLDLTGCTARMQIRAKVNSDTPLLSATSLPYDEHPDSGGRILIEPGGEKGRVDVVLTDLDTDKLVVKKGYYDMELEWPLVTGAIRPRVDRLLEGTVTVDLNVTRGVIS